jgi:hydroxymethylbilane synthase
VRALLAAAGHETQRVEIKTTGDLAPDVPLSRIGTRALFTKQIDDALLERRIDLAVHSLKDLPTQLPAGIRIGAVGQRQDPTDALIGHGAIRWNNIPKGALIGTSSLRRRAQLLHHRPDLQVVDLRGNVDTRLAKLDSHPEWTAIVLATAGLLRLGLEQRIGERLPPELMVPAPGQGALAVAVRTDDRAIGDIVRRAMHDAGTALLVAAERGFLSRLEGGCQVPVGAYATLNAGDSGSVLSLHGRVIALEGRTMIEGRESAPVASEAEAAALGKRLAEQLLADGAGAILADARTSTVPSVTEP